MKTFKNKLLSKDIEAFGLGFYSFNVKESRSRAISDELNQLHQTLVTESESLEFNDEAFNFSNTLKSLKR